MRTSTYAQSQFMIEMASDGVRSRVYHGNCHCGRYRFSVSTADDIAKTEVLECSCSLCAKKGYLWLELPPGAFQLLRDDGCLVAYESGVLGDKFCNQCGTGILGTHSSGPLAGKDLVNVRTLLGVKPFKIEENIQRVVTQDSRQPPTLDLESMEANVHNTGSCHCGKVRIQILVPLSELELKEDNCSSCVRNAYIGAYPQKSQVIIHGGEETFEYLYNRRFTGTAHCKTCGVTVYSNVYGPPLSVFDDLPPERKEVVMAAYWKNMALQPINVRALDGIDVKDFRDRIVRSDEGTEGYIVE